MNRLLFSIIFLFLCLLSFSQGSDKNTVPKPGTQLNETINYFKDNGTAATYPFPNNAFTLFYRFNNVKGIADNYDSVYAVVNHVYRLNRYFGPRRKPSRLTCAIFVKQVDAEAIAIKNKINAWSAAIGDSLVKTNRAGFNFNRPWHILFVTDTVLKPGSILSAGKVSIVSAEGQLLETSPIKTFKFNGKKGSVKGKLLTEHQGKKVPVPNVLVSLFRIGVQSPDSAVTDAYGDFELEVPDQNSEYNIVVKTPNKDLDNIILATQSGQEISRLEKTKGGFEYKLIPVELVKLTELDVQEDISLVFQKFGKSKDTDLKVTENILYALGQYKIEEEAKPVLNKVIAILKDNPKVKLDVISHTDAQGIDKDNQVLSEKRSKSVVDYFISKGIQANRLKAIGKGEMEIRNRCINDVDCSDMEHEYNRRTEFKFTKT